PEGGQHPRRPTHPTRGNGLGGGGGHLRVHLPRSLRDLPARSDRLSSPPQERARRAAPGAARLSSWAGDGEGSSRSYTQERSVKKVQGARRAMSRCIMMNTSSRAPMTILVHQELRVPSNEINVCTVPSTRTPSTEPAT